jgi:hypothetical protein
VLEENGGHTTSEKVTNKVLKLIREKRILLNKSYVKKPIT